MLALPERLSAPTADGSRAMINGSLVSLKLAGGAAAGRGQDGVATDDAVGRGRDARRAGGADGRRAAAQGRRRLRSAGG